MFVERIVNERGFAGAGNAGDADHQSRRDRDVHATQVVSPGTPDPGQAVWIHFEPLARHRNGPLAGQVVAGDGVFVGDNIAICALGDHPAAVDAGAGAHVDDVIRGTNGIFVVLHDDDRVAQVAQPGQGREQALVVALMQADGGLVQHVHDAHQARADLAGEPDPLGFAAGKGVGAAIQAQVFQADVGQEAQAIIDLLGDLGRDLALGPAQLQPGEERQGLAHRQAHELRQGPVGDEYVARGLVEPAAATVGTGLGAEVARQFLADDVGLGLPIPPFHVGNDAFKGVSTDPGIAFAGEITELYGAFPTPIQYGLANGLRQILERGVRIEAVMRRQGLDHLEVVSVAPVPSPDRATGQRQCRTADHAEGVEILFYPQAVAGGAGPLGVVEREQSRFQFRQPVAALRAGETGGEREFFTFRGIQGRRAEQAVGEV